MRCWQCGVEPLEVHNVQTLSDPGPVLIPGRWPAGDHEHAVDPPTPDELVEQGRRAVDRVMAAWLGPA